MAEEKIRLELGFEGGQGMVVHVESPTADALERALAETPEQAFAIDAEDGRYTVRLNRVVYLKRFARESRVGFGG